MVALNGSVWIPVQTGATRLLCVEPVFRLFSPVGRAYAYASAKRAPSAPRGKCHIFHMRERGKRRRRRTWKSNLSFLMTCARRARFFFIFARMQKCVCVCYAGGGGMLLLNESRAGTFLIRTCTHSSWHSARGRPQLLVLHGDIILLQTI